MALTMRDAAILAFRPSRRRHDRPVRPGPAGEHVMQDRHDTAQRAQQFYRNQVTDELTPAMREFIERMTMAFVATSDSSGECDCTFRAGPAGFIRVLDDRTVAYPEYRGNGVMASMGNILRNPHVAILLIDFTQDLIGLHVNGSATVVTAERMAELGLAGDEDESAGRRPVQWVLVRVIEAYVHCSKRIPKLVPQSRVGHFGAGNPRHKGNDYFGVTASRTARAEPVPAEPVPAEPVPAEPAPVC